MENRAEIYCEVKQWLEDLLKRRFAADSKALNKLSAIDMFYLCVEVYAGYNVKICQYFLEMEIKNGYNTQRGGWSRSLIMK